MSAKPRSTPGPPTYDTERAIIFAVTLWPAFGLAIWYGAAWFMGNLDEPFSRMPGPPQSFVNGLALVVGSIVATLLLVMLVRGRRYRRKANDARVSTDLARMLKVERTVHARVRARKYGQPSDLVLVGVRAPESAHDALAARFAQLTGADPAEVAVCLTRNGTRIRVERSNPYADDDLPDLPAAPDFGPAEFPASTEDEKCLPLTAPAVDQDVLDRATGLIIGALGPAGRKGISVETLAVHPNGAPSKMRVRYDPTKAAIMGETVPKIASTLTASLVPVNGMWRYQWIPRSDMVILTDDVDPLNRVIRPTPADPDVDLRKGILIGDTEHGGGWFMQLLGLHWYIGGVTGSGKSSLLWAIIQQLAGRVGNGTVRMIGLDRKRVELAPMAAAGAFHRFEHTSAGINAALTDVLEDMEARQNTLAERGLFEIEELTPEMPFVLIVVDEAMEMAKDPSHGNEFKDLMARIVNRGRALGYGVIITTTDVRSEQLPFRDQIPASLCLRVRTPRQVDMVLGQGRRTEGAYADQIPKNMIGVAYAFNDETGDIERVRSTFIPKEDRTGIARGIGQSIRAEIEPPAHTPAPLGRVEQAALYDAQDQERERERARRAPRALTAVLDPVPDPEPATDDVWISVDELVGKVLDDGVAYCQFEDNPSVVKVTAAEESETEAGWVTLTCIYTGQTKEWETEIEDTESVILRSEADFQ